MPVLFTYLLKLSVALSIVYFFYAVALRRLTFYNWNRWYLLLYTALCFLFPLVDVSSLFIAGKTGGSTIIYLVPTLSDFNTHVIASETTTRFFTAWSITAILLISGMLFLAGRLFVQLYSYRRMAQKAKLISDEGIRVYETQLSAVPFSFGRSVFINPNQHTDEELAEIIKHEFVHVKQRHTVDVIWGELLCIVNWFNPFAWMIRNAIRQNLEFIADDKVLQEGIDKKQYQYLLLKVTGNKHFRIAHSFNFSSLKKRIAMMNKTKTARLQLMRFLFILPVVVMMLLVFRKESVAQKNSNKKETETIVNGDTVAPVSVKEVTLVPLPPGLINYQKDIKDVTIRGSVITVLLKNEIKEQYNLNDKKQKEALEKKYGKMQYVPAVVDKMDSVPVKHVILEPRPGENNKGSSINKSSIKDKSSTMYLDFYVPEDVKKIADIHAFGTNVKMDKNLFTTEDNIHVFSYWPSSQNQQESSKIEKAIFTAKYIHLNSKKHTLNLKGNASFNSDKDTGIEAAEIELNFVHLGQIPTVFLNNKQVDLDKDYLSNEEEKYELVFLNKSQAIVKYGDKGKEGAVEITSL